MSDQTYTTNDDGSVSIAANGKNTRYVKESDLLTVKGGSEAKVREWETERTKLQSGLAEANRIKDETHQTMLQERAAREQLETKYSDYDTWKSKVGELETQIGTHKEGVGRLEKELTERIRHSLTSRGAKEDTLKDKTLDQLRNLEEAASIFGAAPRQPRFDGGSTQPTTPAETPAERARRVIEDFDRKMGRATS